MLEQYNYAIPESTGRETITSSPAQACPLMKKSIRFMMCNNEQKNREQANGNKDIVEKLGM
jgi:hypothetical protein